jgi:hypothetical protein
MLSVGARSFLVKVECKDSTIVPHSCTLISGQRNPQRRKGAQLDEIRDVPLMLVKVTFLRNGQEWLR